jgi:hypothetical protein
MSDALAYLLKHHQPHVIKWALGQCLRYPKQAKDVVATMEPNEAARPSVLNGLRTLAKMKPEARPESVR